MSPVLAAGSVLEDRRPPPAEYDGRPAISLGNPRRSRGRMLLAFAGLGFALWVLLPQIGQAHAALQALSHANWAWLPAVALASGATYLMAAVALTGATAMPLVLRRAWAVQVAAAFTNRLAPAGLGGMVTNVRYLEASGADRPSAMTAVGLSSLAGFLVHVGGVLALVPLLGLNAAFRIPSLPHHWPLLAVVIGALAQPAVARWGHRCGRHVRRYAQSMATSLRAIASERSRVGALFLGSAGVTAGYALGLVAAVQALGGGVGAGQIVAVYLCGAALAAASPTQGGLGALEAALVAGLTRFGMATGPAVSAVLVYRLVTYWLPVLPGAILYRGLRRRKVL